MKLDMSKLPVLEAVVGFLLLTLIVTFVLAFEYVETPASPADEISPTPSEAPSGSATPPPNGAEIAIAMQDNRFDPDAATVTAGETASFTLTNEGAAIHNMRIAGEDGEYQTDDDAVSDPEAIRAGQDGTLTWDVPAAAGEIEFRCDFHPVEMVGTITVQ
jgi:plastocyanin